MRPTLRPLAFFVFAALPSLTLREVRKLLHGLRGINLMGADFVCYCPPLDNPAEITALTVSLLSVRQRDAPVNLLVVRCDKALRAWSREDGMPEDFDVPPRRVRCHCIETGVRLPFTTGVPLSLM
jgi:hypothetical protein